MLTECEWQAILKEHLIASRMRCLLAVYTMSPRDAIASRILPDQAKIASKDIAEMIAISRPSVHVLLDALQKENLIFKEHYGRVSLTPSGRKKAAYQRRHICLMTETIRERLSTSTVESAVLAGQCVDMMDAERLAEIEDPMPADAKDVMTC